MDGDSPTGSFHNGLALYSDKLMNYFSERQQRANRSLGLVNNKNAMISDDKMDGGNSLHSTKIRMSDAAQLQWQAHGARVGCVTRTMSG